MLIIEIHLILQRPATPDEIREYENLKRLFDEMTPEERKAQGISRVQHLAGPDNPAAHVTRYTNGAAKFDEIYKQSGKLQTGVPGATEMLKRVVSTMLSQYRTNRHESFYVLGNLSKLVRASEKTGKLREVGFRTLIARTLL
jgi:hypothetical protein